MSRKWLKDTEIGDAGHVYLGVYFTRYVKRIPSKYWKNEGGKWANNSVDIKNLQTKEEIEIIKSINIIGIEFKNNIEEAIEIVKTQSPYKKWNGNKLLLPEGFWDSWILSYSNIPIYYYLKDKTV